MTTRMVRGLMFVIGLVLMRYATAPTQADLLLKATDELSQVKPGEFLEFPGNCFANVVGSHGTAGKTMLLQFCQNCVTRRWTYEQVAGAGGKPVSKRWLAKYLRRKWLYQRS